MALRMAASSSGWRDFCADPDRLDAGLRDRLDDGAPIVLTSRFSTPTGENARSSAINSLFEAARVLDRQSGIDVVSALPSREDLDLRLRNAPVTTSPRLEAGKDIKHRFVTVDLRPAAPAVLLLATGTGRIAAKGFIQPFTQRAAHLVWDLEAALLATKRWDRTNRNDNLVGPLVEAMEQRAAWVCIDHLFRVMNRETRMLLMLESFAARSNTTDGDYSKRLGQADRTGRKMIRGQVAYHLPSSLPPGLGVATLKRRPNLDKERIAYLDMPGCRPDPSKVAEGLSEVRDEKGQVVDQVALVRFFLAHYGDPAWMDNDRIFTELHRRRFSTARIRSFYGADAHATATRGYTAWESILENLEVYETGVLRRSPGGEVPTVEIAGVMPPDRPWAAPEDFARIRAHLAEGKEKAGRAVRLPLSAIRATYDGVACRTRSVASPSGIHQADPCLGFRRVREDRREVRVDKHVLLPWATFAESIADAIIAAGAQALGPLSEAADTAAEAAGDGLASRIREIEEQLEMLHKRQAALTAQLGEVGADGRPVLRGRLLAAAQQQYEDVEACQIPELERQRQDLVTQQRASTPSPDAAEPQLLPRLLASLRDPSDHTYTAMWRRIISPLVFTTAASDHGAKNSRWLRWRGAIRLDAGAQSTVVIPFEGAYHYRRLKPGRTRPGFRERQHDFLEAMRAGVPYNQTGLPARHVNRPRVARLLDVDADHPLFECDDPRIVATATALLLRERGDDRVTLPDEDDGFTAAVRRVHVDDRSPRRWRRQVPPMTAAFYELAAGTGVVTVEQLVRRCDTTPGSVHTIFSKLRKEDPNWGSMRKRGYQLAACRHCASHDRRPAVITEIDGLLCRACERDDAGVRWPLSDYASYLAAPAPPQGSE